MRRSTGEMGRSSAVNMSSKPLETTQTASRMSWLVWHLALTCFFLVVATTDLHNFRPVSADEVTIMAVSHKLATEGVLGSDLETGFFNADQHFFVNLPAHHLWQAVVFRLLGTGVPQARAVSLFFAVALIWLVGWVAWRWYGLGTAVITTFLLVFWRSYLTGDHPGLPFLAVARSGRYDTGAVWWMWATIALFGWTLKHPSRPKAFLLGICMGLAALTQFFSAFIVPFVFLAWWGWEGKKLFQMKVFWWMVAGFALIILPYACLIIFNWKDFTGQLGTYHRDRTSFGSLDFWSGNLLNEPKRYSSVWASAKALFQTPISSSGAYGAWLFFLLTIPYLFAFSYQFKKHREPSYYLLGGSLFVTIFLLMLVEKTKASLYAIPLWPSICLVVGWGLAKTLRWAYKSNWWIGRRIAVGLIIMTILGLVLFDAAIAYGIDWQQKGIVSDYLTTGQQIEAYLSPDGRILGENRWWWALHQYPYYSVGSIFFQSRAAFMSTGELPPFASYVQEKEIDIILLNRNFEGDFYAFPPSFREQFYAYLTSCTRLEAEIQDKTYGLIQVFTVPKNSPLPECNR